MRSLVTLGLFATYLMLASLPAHACEAQASLQVVGFDADGKHVLVRTEGLTIALVKVELSSGLETKSWEITKREDPDAQRESLRRQRWKAAEAELKTAGFTFSPKYPAVLGDKLGVGDGLALLTESVKDANGFSGTQLVATRGKERIVIVPAMPAPPTDIMSLGSLHLSPDKRYIITTRDGCEQQIFVFEVAALAGRFQPIGPTPTK